MMTGIVEFIVVVEGYGQLWWGAFGSRARDGGTVGGGGGTERGGREGRMSGDGEREGERG